MSRDLYASLSGAQGAWTQIEMLAHNLSNAHTTGFKASRMTFELTGPGEHPLGEAYAGARGESVDGRDGAVVPDGVPTHLALQGTGFFVLESEGAAVLTRDGRFSVRTDGALVDASGQRVLGEQGPLYLPEGEDFTVRPDGTIVASESGEIGRLRIETGAQVRPLGQNRFSAEGALVRGSATVLQGGLEQSNVDPMKAMVELVQAGRIFEAYQKAMQASDELDARLNRIGG